MANFKTSDMPINAKYDVESSINLVCKLDQYLQSRSDSSIRIDLEEKDNSKTIMSICFDC